MSGLALSGQEGLAPLYYSGGFEVGSTPGQAEFDYEVNEADTIRSGGFSFTGGRLPPGIAEAGELLAIKGHYQAGAPDAEWTFALTRAEPAGEGILDGYEYRLKLNGEHHLASGSVLEDAPDGKWTHTVTGITASQPDEELFSAELEFAKGAPRGTVRLTTPTSELLGRYNRQGLAQDVWVIYQDFEPVAGWRFNEGRLTEVDLYSDADTTTIPVFGAVTEGGKTVPIDGNYLRVLDEWQKLSGRESELGTSVAGKLLNAMAERQADVARAASGMGMAGFSPAGSVTLPHFPIAKREAQRLSKIAKTLGEVDSIRRQLTLSNSLTIVEGADAEAAYAMASLKTLVEDFLGPVRQLTQAQEKGLLAFLPRDRYLASLWPRTVAPGMFPVEFQGQGGLRKRAFSGPGSRDFQVGEGGLAEISALTDYALESAKSIRDLLGGKLNTKQRRGIVTAQESVVEYEIKRLDSLVERQSGKDRRAYHLKEVLLVARGSLKEYLADEDLTTKRERGQQVVTCMESLEALTLTLVDLPQKQEEIRQLYTDRVWNHNLAVLMSEKVKKRVYDAYADILVPDLVSRVAEGLTCRSAAEINQRLLLLESRLTDLRKEDTDALERRLRGVKDPEAIWRLLSPPSR